MLSTQKRNVAVSGFTGIEINMPYNKPKPQGPKVKGVPTENRKIDKNRLDTLKVYVISI